MREHLPPAHWALVRPRWLCTIPNDDDSMVQIVDGRVAADRRGIVAAEGLGRDIGTVVDEGAVAGVEPPRIKLHEDAVGEARNSKCSKIQ